MRIRIVLAWMPLIGLALLSGCKSQPDTLFTMLDRDDTGLEFRNDIFGTEDFNIITQQYIYNGGGVAIGDFNNDGLQDIFFSGSMVPNQLYLNQGELKFKNVSETAGIGGALKWKSGVSLVDINNDGWLDVYVCSTMSKDSTLRRNMMLVNQGLSPDGTPTFVDKAKDYGIEYDGYKTNGVFFDYDNDNDLDLFILTNTRQALLPAKYMPKVNNGTSTNTDKLFRNNNDGTFTDVGVESGIVCEGYGLGVAVVDVNKDGLTDIYVSNDYITNDLLYINLGGGKFENRIDDGIKHQAKFSMGNDVADINNDGLPDIMTVDMLPETNLRKKTVIVGGGYNVYINDRQYDYAHQHVRNMLQLNNGDGTFSEIGMLAGVYQTEWSWTPLFADFDNDGFKDLLVTNGFPKDITDRDFISFRQRVSIIAGVNYLLDEVPSVKVPNYVFRNNGDLTFANKSNEWGINQPSFSNGAAYADLDNDGDLDFVVNNIDDFATLYKNNLNDEDPGDRVNHYLRIKLKGPTGNSSGLGTKATLRYDGGKQQYVEHGIYRGYVSTVEDVIHFGLGEIQKVDSLYLQWPDGKAQLLTDVPADQVLTIEYAKASESAPTLKERKTVPLFREVTKQAGIAYKAAEEDKIDFNVQRTLPHKFSQQGPGVAVGDVNGDELEDFYVGGAAGVAGMIFTQGGTGAFSQKALQSGSPKLAEETGVLLFDADNDNDLDLYAVSGSYEYEAGSPNYQDILYINDGNGRFTSDSKALPPTGASGSCVRGGDFDGDGDLDLFVGGRVPPGSYPFADESYVLRNDGGKFTNITAQLSADLVKPGMVTDALWTDFDDDGKLDLVVVGEFMAVQFFRNKGETFERISSGIDNEKGWFFSISGGDFDNDGDTDYIVGNLGLNNSYNCNSEQPMTAYGKDFDSNGSVDAVISCYVKAEDGTMKPYPVHFWDDMNSQSPQFRRKFLKYKEFAATTTDKFFDQKDLEGAVILDATFLTSAYVENKGGGQFAIRALPMIAQVAPVNGLVPSDFDGDGNLDVLMVGNDYGNEPTVGQYDAFTGLLLRGDGKGNFKPVTSAASGFTVNGDAKGLARLSSKAGDMFVATQNMDSLKVFSTTSTGVGRTFAPQVSDRSAVIVSSDGKRRKVEFYFGSGYLSQSTRSLSIGPDVKEIIVTDIKGTSRTVSATSL